MLIRLVKIAQNVKKSINTSTSEQEKKNRQVLLKKLAETIRLAAVYSLAAINKQPKDVVREYLVWFAVKTGSYFPISTIRGMAVGDIREIGAGKRGPGPSLGCDMQTTKAILQALDEIIEVQMSEDTITFAAFNLKEKDVATHLRSMGLLSK